MTVQKGRCSVHPDAWRVDAVRFLVDLCWLASGAALIIEDEIFALDVETLLEAFGAGVDGARRSEGSAPAKAGLAAS